MAASCSAARTSRRRCSSASTWSPSWSTTPPTATCCATSSGCTRGGIPARLLTNPDFQAYAKAFGVGAWQVETADQLKGALREAIASNAPALIEVVSDITKDYPPYEFHQPKRA